MHARLALVLLTVFTLTAGCLQEGAGLEQSSVPQSTAATTSPTSEPSSSTTSSSAAPTTAAAPAPAGAPKPNLTSDVSNGSIPLLVTFTLADDGEQQGDWVLAFGDGESENGTGLPHAISHTFTTIGTFKAELTLTIGDKSGTDSVEIVTTAAPAAASAGQHVEGAWLNGATGCLASWEAWAFGTPLKGVVVQEFTVDPASIGTTFLATFTLEDAATTLFVGVDFYGTDNMLVDGFANLDGPTVTDVVPAGAVNGLVYHCGPRGASVVYDAGLPPA